MFCDLVGSTKLSQQMDPEEFHLLINQYQKLCEEIVVKLDGYVAQYLGDGVLIYFGYPKAHEDDAHRAVKASIDIIKNLKDMSISDTRLRSPLKVRIGIHTGNVVMGNVGRSTKNEQLAMGDVPNIAALIQKQAKPNQILISQNTYQLVKGSYATRKSKSVVKPGFVFSIVGKSTVHTRFEAHSERRLTPLVGRVKELRELSKLWEEVKKSSQGGACLINGEAGIGKSRLVHEFKQSIVAEPYAVLESQCWDTAKNSPLSPILNLLESMLKFEEKDSQEAKTKKLERFLRKHKVNLKDKVPLLSNLLSIQLSTKYQTPLYTPEKLKQESMRAFAKVLDKISETTPVVFILEDLHWADPSTLEFLSIVIKEFKSSRILLLYTSRPEYKSDWDGITKIDLSHLDKMLSAKMVGELIRKIIGSDQLAKEIVSRSDGIPLYIEEISKARLSIDDRNNLSSIPISLNDHLMSRLDKLGEAKEVAQVASIIGRDFDKILLRSLMNINIRSLKTALDKLVQNEIVFVINKDTLTFKHALIQDAAYESLPRNKRKELHSQTATVIEEKFVSIKENHPDLLAYHYEQAGMTRKAVQYLTQAGNLALSKSALMEASAHFEKGLTLLNSLSFSRDKDLMEVDILKSQQIIAFANCMVNASYFFEISEKLVSLCMKLKLTETLCSSIQIYVSMLYTVDIPKSLSYVRKINRLSKQIDNKAIEVSTITSHASTLGYIGNYTKSSQLYNTAIDLYDQYNLNNSGFFVNSKIEALGQSSWLEWQLGFADIAISKIKEGMKLSKQSDNLTDLSFTMVIAALNHLNRNEFKLAKTLSLEGIEYNDRLGLLVYISMFEVLLIYSSLRLNNHDEISSLLEKLQTSIESEFHNKFLVTSLFQEYILESLIACSEFKQALEIVKQSIKQCNKAGNEIILSQLYKIQGDCFLSISYKNKKKAEECYIQSLEIARKQKTRFFELKTVNSYSNLLLKQGREKEAKLILSRIIRWFDGRNKTEIDELNEAKNLLEQLS